MNCGPAAAQVKNKLRTKLCVLTLTLRNNNNDKKVTLFSICFDFDSNSTEIARLTFEIETILLSVFDYQQKRNQFMYILCNSKYGNKDRQSVRQINLESIQVNTATNLFFHRCIQSVFTGFC